MTETELEVEPWTSSALLAGFTLTQAVKVGGPDLARVILLRMQIELALDRADGVLAGL